MSEPADSGGSEIPVTPMHTLYLEFRALSQKRRLEEIQSFLEHPARLEDIFSESVDQYRKDYSNPGEPFHPTRPQLPPLPPDAEIRSGRDLERALAHPEGKEWEVTGGGPVRRLRFVDYQVPPLRTTGETRFADGKLGFTADLLLVDDEGVPVVGEVKAVTDTHYDVDSGMALIQALAQAAALSTPQQQERLDTHYRSAEFASDRGVGVSIITIKPAVAPPRARHQADLSRAARDLAAAISRLPGVSSSVEWIAFIQAEGNNPPSLSVTES